MDRMVMSGPEAAVSRRQIRESVTCGNPRHPHGAWHPAEPESLSRIERFRQWWRRRKYGCGCRVWKHTPAPPEMWGASFTPTRCLMCDRQLTDPRPCPWALGEVR